MKKLFSIALVAVIGLSPALTVRTAEASTSYITSATVSSLTDMPTWIIAPSIGLYSPIQAVGVNKKGEMDVPPGHTNNVGWYQYGVAPGDTGTAVLDAHVFAAFRNLNLLQPGESFFVYMSSGEILEFRVKQSNFYDLASLSPHTLFEPTAEKQLNLITCAGQFLGTTYSHRLIVSAELV